MRRIPGAAAVRAVRLLGLFDNIMFANIIYDFVFTCPSCVAQQGDPQVDRPRVDRVQPDSEGMSRLFALAFVEIREGG